MAEVKNAFIKSKMNQDLDDRLIPSGEYREGINIQVSKSEGADVGALQNVLGNKKAVDFRVITGVNDLVTIGQFTDATNNVIYVFLTNYTDPNPSFQPTYSSSAKNFIYSYNVLNGDTAKLVEGSFLNFSTTNTVYGVNILENLLFWTDNRNQPRKINITSATQVPGYYTTEDQISVAKLNPYEPIELYREVNSIWETTMLDKTSLLLPDGITANPNYDAQYAGDPDFLEDKFVRFSYRYIFDDGEHSIIAPFTQPAFIPKQDGYFLSEDTNVSGNTEAENAAYRSTIVEFMENKVDNILLQIPLPTIGSNTFNDFKITEIEILYKESDQIAVQVVDVITQEEIKETTTSVFEYNYQARKPFRTLPDSDIIRVYDKIPVRALGQEIISNRIVYSNFQDKHTPPEYLDYNVGAFNKSSFNVTSGNISTNTTSIVEYPTHTIKQNRNYQVGVVLSDKYGRSSSTILSIVNDGDIGGASGSFGGSTYYHPYKDSTDNAPATWPGDALKVLFNSIIPNNPADLQTGWPGLYNGNSNSSNYNPLGWYSYKIVVKQTEQDYYNVYLPGILNEAPGGSLDDPKNTIAYITLLNDNINKVPRDLNEVGPNQKQYRSSVQLFGRVTPDNILPAGPTFNEQYYPGRESHTVSTIGEENDLLGSVTDYVDIYQSASNPSLARLTQSNLANPIGANVHSGGNYNILLGIYETNPEESRLDIFWETSTTGLISDLNEAIATGTNQATGLDLWNFSQSEADPIGTAVTGEFAPLDITDQPINSSVVTLNSVVDGTGTPRSGWELVEVPGTPNRWYLKTTSNFYYGVNGSTKESYTFTLG